MDVNCFLGWYLDRYCLLGRLGKCWKSYVNGGIVWVGNVFYGKNWF